jgi:hypothetical protein
MQLHLKPDELKLLADLLLEQDQRKYADLLDKVLAQDLRFDADELQESSDLLAAAKARLKSEIAAEDNRAHQDTLQPRLALLERVLERINEACVMF